MAQVQAVTGEQVRQAFERMQHAGASVALTGSVGRATTQRVREALSS